VVHTHRHTENQLGSLATLAPRRTRSLRTVHGKPEHRAGSAIRRLALRAMDGVATRLQRRIVGVSDDLCTELRAIYPPQKVVCIPNGIDTRAVAERSLHEPGCAIGAMPSVAFVGRFVPVKRVDVFLRAAAEICRSDSPQTRFVAVGDGPLHGECVELARQLGIADRVDFPGFQPNSLPIIRQMSCIVLTSDHEGLPMVVLEALALGVPVVAPKVGGLPEVLAGIPQCRLVSARTPAGFAEAILEVLSARRAQGTPTGQPVGSLLPVRYDIETASAAYASLYRELSG
jgi:glycosyltransferase involved in cell wall biosynthesis